MIDPDNDKTGINIIEALADVGFDYIELSIRDIMALEREAYTNLSGRVRKSGILCESCNNFMPRHLKMTGETVDRGAVLSYIRDTAARASELGTRIIVFGSPWVRDVDPGFSKDTAFSQMADILTSVGDIVREYDIIIAMEHVNRVDGNIFTSIPETLNLVRTVNHPNVRLLIDFFHMQMEKEPVDEVLDAGSLLSHIHFARLYKRLFPKDFCEDENYSPFFQNLKKISYNSRISIEAYTRNFLEDAGESLAFLRGVFS
ncbi:MAG: sugar phosphate isomerase/epimerase [Synergistaceae bacterium]|jgi:sugar phosphate isomerase/epimerase|nr:sugar phosphate isomerase/epimerase [Synergistaceae bacterium]